MAVSRGSHFCLFAFSRTDHSQCLCLVSKPAIRVCWPAARSIPTPCETGSEPDREICCNCASWDQLYQLYPPYDILSSSHKNEVACPVHLVATLSWRLMQSLSFLLETFYLFCPDGFGARLICWPHAGADVAVQALILCAFQSIVGNFEAVPFLRWHFRICRLAFISISFAHCSSIRPALRVDQKDPEDLQ